MTGATAPAARGVAPDRMAEITVPGRASLRAALLRLDERSAQVRVPKSSSGLALKRGATVGFFGLLEGHYYVGTANVQSDGGEDVTLVFDSPLRKRACRSTRRVEFEGVVMVRGYSAEGQPMGWAKARAVNVSTGGLGLLFEAPPPCGRVDLVVSPRGPEPRRAVPVGDSDRSALQGADPRVRNDRTPA